MEPGTATSESPGESLEWQVSPGLTPYQEALDAMTARIAAIRAGAAPEQVWLVEHPPLFTAGTSARPEDLRAADMFPTFNAGRGGQWTYHGPGQRVAYVMLDLTRPHGLAKQRDIHAYVSALEEWLIRTLQTFNVRGERRQGRVGIWVTDSAGRESKIAAIGVRVTRWITWHGISLNIAPNLTHFTGIIPCGITQHGVTSLAALGRDVTTAEVDEMLKRKFKEVFKQDVLS